MVSALKSPDLSQTAEDVLLPSSRDKPLPIQQSLQPRSLALASVMAARRGRPLSAELENAIQMLEGLGTTIPDADFWKWVESLAPEQEDYLELQWARRLREMVGVNSALRQQTLQVCWLGERVAAAALGSQPWVQPTIDAADRERLTAERDLLDPGRLRDDAHVSNSLRQAFELYVQAARQLQTIGAARRLEHDLLDRVADYVEWHNLAPVGSSAPVPASDTIERLLDELSDLVRELGNPQPASLARIEQISNRLKNLRQKIESDLRPAFVASLLAPPGPVPWNAGLLLATPRPPWAARLRLLANADRLDLPLDLSSSRSPSDRAPAAAGPLGGQAWSALKRRADLELRVARLAMIDCPHGQRLIENLAALPAGDEQHPPSSAQDQLAHYRRLGAAFEAFYAALPDLIQASLARTNLHSDERAATVKHWRWADLASRLIDPRDEPRLKDYLPAQQVERSEFDALVAWHRKRLLASSVEVTALQARYLSEAAREYFAALAADGYDVPHEIGVQPVDLRTPTAIDLRRADRREARLAVQSSEVASDVWLVVEYDPQLIAVRTAVDRPMYFADRTGSGPAAPLDRTAAPRVRPLTVSASQTSGPPGDSTAAAGAAPAGAARLFDLPPSLSLSAGASGELKVVIDRKSPSQTPASLIVSAWTRETVSRQAIEVSLPKPALARLSVDAQPGCWSATGQTVKLYPFPNRVTPYRLLLSRADQPTEKISAELRLLAGRPNAAIPDTAMEPDEAADLLDHLPTSQALGSVAELVLPVSGQSVPLAFKAAPPPPPPAAKEGAEAAEPAPPSLENGLLLAVTDLASKRVMIRWIEFMPQRPRRFIDPHVDYDLASERVRLRVRPQEGVTLPPDGSRIRWELTGVDEGAIPGPAGEITPAAPERVLSTRPSPQTNPVTLFVDIDGYPRSFAFRLETDATSVDVPKADLVAIKLTAPTSGTAYRLPSAPIAVRLQADVPSDDLSGSEDFIEVGLDTNRDRLLADEPTVRLTADRQTAVTLDKLNPNGALAVRAEVRDLAVEIPTASVASGRVGVLGRVCLAGKSVWSSSVELILDGEPPRIDRVTLKPGAKLVRGGKLDVLATATDGDLSGVAKVEMALDAENLGRFAE
ncbi:MAG TPA: hypothetical protein VHY20_08815, partial [Pirellulales bacterium]|nr:hypothetical protein [Pirellulales bacterium]